MLFDVLAADYSCVHYLTEQPSLIFTKSESLNSVFSCLYLSLFKIIFIQARVVSGFNIGRGGGKIIYYPPLLLKSLFTLLKLQFLLPLSTG